jgi:ubiquinone biosynthesis monooxygenase Coq6
VADARVSALTPASVALLDRVGAWARLKRARARPFTAMQVWDARAAGHVRYDAHELGADSLGHVVENRLLHAALAETADLLGVTSAPPGAVSGLDLEENRAFAEVALRPPAKDAADETNDARARVIRARVVIGADGASSRVRDLAGVRAHGWSYALKAACGTVRLSRPSDVAWQRFLPDGPLAVLPATDDPCVANVVWTNVPDEADRIAGLSDAAFAEEVDRALRGIGRYDFRFDDAVPSSRSTSSRFSFPSFGSEGERAETLARQLVSKVLRPFTERGVSVLEAIHGNGGLGGAVGLVGGAAFEDPPAVVSAPSGGRRGAFPLAARIAGRHVARRLALIGDAAHQVHPLGGQGVNLGLRDAEVLVSVFEECVETGGDVGSARCLARYQAKARNANVPMMLALDGLQKLFALDSSAAAWARGFGLAGVNALGPLRREIAKYAMGG